MSTSVFEIICTVIGGLGIFLFGMKNMSEGLQAVAGHRLRKLINAITNNRLIACGVGTFVTTIIQSSSVTTVMVVGMVNAGIMTLVQAIGVILGANIGTTITGWILVLKIGKWGLPILGIAVFFYLFASKDRIRYIASIFFGLGMIFFGLELMKDGFSPIRDMPEFIEWFQKFSPTSYFGVLKCCMAGAILTAIVQSSSATLGITIGLATTGIIDYPTAAALVLGENIGTTITALLASIGASTNAKRASYAHTAVNVLGVIWITAIFSVYIKFIQWVIHVPVDKVVYTETGTSYPNIAKGIAMTHTMFNVVNVILFLPLIGYLAKLLKRLVPDKAIPEGPRLTFLDVRMLDAPSIAIQQSQKEIVRMADKTEEMISVLGEQLTSLEPNAEREELIFKYENDMDILQKEVVEFLGNITAGNISREIITDARLQLRLADEYESISDYITNILKLMLKMRQTEQVMSSDGHKELLDLHHHVARYIHMVNQATKDDYEDLLSLGKTQGQSITHLMKEYRSRHLARVGTGPTTPLKSLFYTDMLNAYRRIKDHAFNIVEVLAGEK